MNKNPKASLTKLRASDKILAKAIKPLKPLSLPASGNVYHELVKSIIYQQISYKAADTIYARFISLFDDSKFSPQTLLQYSFESLKSVGLSRQKTNYILNISEYFIVEDLYDCNWNKYDDDEILSLLCKIKGVGPWTVKMILIFELKREDVFPYEDLAIQYVIKDLYKLNHEKTALITEMKKIAELWKPFRTLASLYLWSYRRSQIELGAKD